MSLAQTRYAALLPLGVFLVIYLGSGIYYQSQGVEFAFYQIKAPVAIMPAILLALLLSKGRLEQRLEPFLKGMGENTILLMCLVFLLSGAFAAITKSIGGVDAAVNLGLSLLPSSLLLPGLFVISAIIATAMGTSMGTIAAVAPLAVGTSEMSDLNLTLAIGAVVGGAMFGDNLSIISDTTIAATRTQDCSMKDKFKANALIALPAAVLTLVVLTWLNDSTGVTTVQASDPWLALPYLIVLALALLGMHVLVVLSVGIIASAFTGLTLVSESYSLAQLTQDIYQGFSNIQEILLLSLFIGGLTGIMKAQGGLDLILSWIKTLIDRSKTPSRALGEGCIAILVSFANLFIANNTIAILISGSLAKSISQDKALDPKRVASILDSFSCIVQGIIPYGAQILLAASLAGLSPLALAFEIHYCWALLLLSTVAIISGYPFLNAKAPQQRTV